MFKLLKIRLLTIGMTSRRSMTSRRLRQINNRPHRRLSQQLELNAAVKNDRTGLLEVDDERMAISRGVRGQAYEVGIVWLSFLSPSKGPSFRIAKG